MQARKEQKEAVSVRWTLESELAGVQVNTQGCGLSHKGQVEMATSPVLPQYSCSPIIYTIKLSS